jgi:superfamily II DNA or RNA helicase
MDIKLRPYQQNIINKITASDKKRVCVSLATGGG